MPHTFRTDALARLLASQPYHVSYRVEPGLTPDQITSETIRLNGLPKAEQIIVFCQAMGFDVRDYLTEKARFNGEADNEVEWMDLDGGAA